MLRLSDKVAVLRDRHMVAELPRAEASMPQVMEVIASGSGPTMLTHRPRSGTRSALRPASHDRLSLFWPVVVLAALLLVNSLVHPGLPQRSRCRTATSTAA